MLKSDSEQKVKVKSYVLTHAKGLQPNTVVSLDIEGEILEESAAGDGQFDAFMNALKKIYQKKKMALPELTDYAVRIPPRGVIPMPCVKPLSLGKMGIKNLSPVDWIPIKPFRPSKPQKKC